MGLSADAYARQIKHLLPRGALWNLEPGSVLSRVALAIADELARIDGRAEALVDEWDPRTTLELLSDWERVLGLPDGCVAVLPTTTVDRQRAVVQKLVARGGQSRQFFIDLAATLGFVVTITEYTITTAASFHAGDLVNGEAWAFAWIVNVNLAASPSGAGLTTWLGTITEFRADSHAGELLYGRNGSDFECIVRRAAPAHTVVLFTYS
jgi:uncharacterized protein YmfQ (DUF2313 family)